MQIPPELDLSHLALSHNGNVQLRDGALEFISDSWAARIPVTTSPDDQDGLLDPYALLIAQHRGWELRVACL